MKVKVFEFLNKVEKAEVDINRWLEANPTAKILFVTQSESEACDVWGVTITLWYERPKK